MKAIARLLHVSVKRIREIVAPKPTGIPALIQAKRNQMLKLQAEIAMLQRADPSNQRKLRP